MKKDYVEEVAAKLIEQLKQGTAPWQKPWAPGERRLPYNPTTGNEYRGFNTIWLESQGYGDPRWMTYKQASGEGAQVRKGEKGTHIVYWKFHDERPMKDEKGRPVLDDEGKPKKMLVALERPRSFTAVVFNAAQIDGLPPVEVKPRSQEHERHARAEAILANSSAKIEHQPGDRAFYRPSNDSITLPEMSQFHTADGYYATALHELGHWTGHPSRLDRDLANPFGSEAYAREELRAEIASLMIGERLDIGHDPGQHAAYVGSWIKVLQNDPREIFRAASDAEKIATFVMAFEQEKTQETQAQVSTLDAMPETVPENQVRAELEHVVQHEPPEQPMNGRTYLAVPYREKDQAKALGAKWDKEAKAWYAPEGADLAQSGLDRWRVDAPRVVAPPIIDRPEIEFANAIREAGLQIKGEPIMDGKIHRVPVDGDRGSERSGAYSGHLEGRLPGGYIQNYKTGERVNWRYEGKVDAISSEERAQLNAEAAQRRQDRYQQRTEQHERTAAAAAALWAEAPAATADNAYCKAKGIAEPDAMGLRVVPDAVSPATAELGIKIAKNVNEAKRTREADPSKRVFMAGDLLIPGTDADGKLWTLQTVNPYFKSFMKEGRKHGLFTIAGADPNGMQSIDTLLADDRPLVLAEGYATADTVARSLGQPVIVAFDSGNLDAVASELRERFPDRHMLIAADNDVAATEKLDAKGRPRKNVGMEKAKETAERHGAGIMAPQFAKGEKGSDWNDYAKANGEDAMRKHLAEQMAAAKMEATINAERLVTLARTRDMEARNDPTTSADDAMIAKERGKAADLLSTTAAQLGQVRSTANDGLVANHKETRPAATVKAALDRTNATMSDKAKDERQKVADQPAKAARARGQGIEL
jgi:putative DNA primase/helicase